MAAVRKQNVIILSPGDTYTLTEKVEVCGQLLCGGVGDYATVWNAQGDTILWEAITFAPDERISDNQEICLEPGAYIDNSASTNSVLYLYTE